MIRRILSFKFLPLTWTFITVILLCLPGSMVPGNGIFGIRHLDKLVHVIMFGMNVLFWGWHFQGTGRSVNQLRNIYFLTAVLAAALGIIMEFVQLNFIPNRSFDKGDIVADVVGSVLAALWLLKR